MTRSEQLKFCKKCFNRKMDLQQGLLCGLTNRKADFQDTCENFQRDESVKDEVRPEVNNEKSPMEKIADLPEDTKAKMRQHENLFYALVGGLFLSIICALIWAVITVITEYQIGYMAIGVGFAVGMGVRFFGAGIDAKFGFIGGFLALLGCLLGNLFSQVGFIAEAETLGYFETLAFLDLQTIILIYEESFSPMDVLFYGIAIYEGYKFAFRPIPANHTELKDFTPAYSKLRFPLVLACFALLLISSYPLTQGITGDQAFYYENGSVQSEGQLVKGKVNGKWQYYYESGKLQLVGNYDNDVEEGIWEWYYESGNLMKKGSYKRGLFDGTWLSYNEEGVLVDSSNYSEGRLNGAYKSFYENGELFEEGQYERDKQVGEWYRYYDNGNLLSHGQFKNGELSGKWELKKYDGSPDQELNYLEGEIIRIVNAWDVHGKQIVKDGNGKFVSYLDENDVLQEGKVTGGKKVGNWTTYYPGGSIKEVGKFENDEYYLRTAWDEHGEIMVEDGNGEYITYYDSTANVLEKGYYKDGLREGKWLVYYPEFEAIQLEQHYHNGALHGEIKTYYANGLPFTEGEFEEGKKIGDWNWYYENGQLQCTIHYQDGKKQGDQVFWTESGIETKKEVYEDGELVLETFL